MTSALQEKKHMATGTQTGSPDVEKPRRAGFVVRFLRFFAWISVAVSDMAFASLASVYVPCFTGVPGACVSGVLLLLGGVFVLVFGGMGVLVLFLTRKGPIAAPPENQG